jgi:hypothetical protein
MRRQLINEVDQVCRTGAVWYQIIFGRVRLRSMTNDLDVSEMFDPSGIDLFIKKLNFLESINAFIYIHSQKEGKKKKSQPCDG